MIAIKSQVSTQQSKHVEAGAAPKSHPDRNSPSPQQAFLAGSAPSHVMQLQKTIGNRAVAKLLASKMASRNVVQRKEETIQRVEELPKPITEIQVQPLLDLITEQRQKISELERLKDLSSNERDSLDKCFRKLTSLFVQLKEAPDPMVIWDSFTEWTETSAWSGGGSEHWDDFIRLSKANEPKEEEKPEEKGEAFSPECENVFADMNAQFKAWDGTTTNRGAWWGSSRPGSTAGAKSVPMEVIKELRKKVKGTTWRFSDSFTGGVSFHRTRSGVDFIYHMLPPN